MHTHDDFAVYVVVAAAVVLLLGYFAWPRR
jgi:hypothetical protein